MAPSHRLPVILMDILRKFFALAFMVQLLSCPVPAWAASSSSNIPLDSPVYSYLEKLVAFGLITSDVKGIKPFSKAEAARLVLEAEGKLPEATPSQQLFAKELLARITDIVPREASLRRNRANKTPFFDYNPISSLRFRYVYVDGIPRSFERPVHDPGNDGVFGLGSGLRPKSPYPSIAHQHGAEGTPLLENNNGVVYHNGNNGELRWGFEAYVCDLVSSLVEPALQISDNDTTMKLNRGYLKLGGESIELELGKDENWLGLGYRGNITLTNNAENLTQFKLSNPEPVRVSLLSWLGDLKYALIAARFDKTSVAGIERQPYLYAIKLISKPVENVEIGFNLGRQVGGPGVDNGIGDNLRGLIGGTGADNSNGLAGFEVRYRMNWLRNIEVYGEFSGEDTAGFWPIVESYVAGIYVPRMTDDGRNDFRFEFFQGNQILYTNGTFPEGYVYKGLPLGHSQGGATQDFFFRYSHWFSVRNNLALEYIFTQRGNVGKVTVDTNGNFDANGNSQGIERSNSARVHWRLPLLYDFDADLTYGYQYITNFNLFEGINRHNQLFVATMTYRY